MQVEDVALQPMVFKDCFQEDAIHLLTRMIDLRKVWDKLIVRPCAGDGPAGTDTPSRTYSARS